MTFIPTNFAENFKREILNHHRTYKIAPKGEYLENLFHNAFVKSGIKSDWTPFNHGVGKDLITEDVNRISVKTGQYTDKSKTAIKYSSYRTTSHDTIKAKLTYIDEQENKIDYYLFCVSEMEEDKIKNKINYTYTIYYKKEVIRTKDFKWTDVYTKKGIHKGWKGTIANAKDMIEIIKAMSHQVWCVTPVNKLKEITKIEVNVTAK